MRIVITGGGGFLGRRLAAAILDRGTLPGPDGAARPVASVVLFDGCAVGATSDPRLAAVIGDVADPAALARAVTPGTGAVFHLAAVVSGAAEADFDLGMRVNLDGTRAVLEACRALPEPPRLVFASSVAAFGPPLPAVVVDATPPTPRASYGVQKVIGELLVTEYTRRGYVDGRAVRIPTVTVRPGKPNRAASSFASGIVREPVAGVEAVCPVAPETVMWVTSPATALANLLHAHALPASAWGADRALSLPGLSVPVGEMVAALARVAGPEAAARVRFARDPAVERIVGSWPGRFHTARADALGFTRDADFDAIVRAYLDETGAVPPC